MKKKINVESGAIIITKKDGNYKSPKTFYAQYDDDEDAYAYPGYDVGYIAIDSQNIGNITDLIANSKNTDNYNLLAGYSVEFVEDLDKEDAENEAYIKVKFLDNQVKRLDGDG